ncbi:MAG: DNA-directed RNA polymerase subunit beta', partial [Planctomycetota bacterium]|nr:DNA-directed RNA polymerase subunit beta' [Planctomycetota bacterium]
RRPKDPAVIAGTDGRVEILSEKRRGKRTIIVRPEVGKESEHLVSPGKHLRVHTGDYVRRGDPLVDGPLDPHEVLETCGEDAVQEYLLQEIQNVYRSQKVDINDKHIEIIIAQMLRKVRVTNGGDTGLLEGTLIDKFEFRRRNAELEKCVKIVEPGDTKFRQGEIVPRDIFEQENARVEMTGG